MSKEEVTKDTSNIDNPYKTVRIGLRDCMYSRTLIFTREWIAEKFINLFGYAFFIIFQCRFFFAALSLQFLYKILLGKHESFNAKLLLKNDITIFANFGHGFLGTY